MKTNGCITCHQIGNQATRTIPGSLGHFENSADAWERRIQSGQAGAQMAANIGNFDTRLALANFGDWTDRVAEGELPAAKPARPSGIERNIVITEWDWASPKSYLHDAISTDKRNPDRQPLWPDLWFGRTQHRRCSGARSGQERRHDDPRAGRRSEDSKFER